MLYTYYGGIYAQKNTALDANGTTLVGYGMESGANATNAQNRNIQEATFGFNQTIWKNGKYGAMQLHGPILLPSPRSLVREAGVQPNANVNMLFFNLRYTLPGSAPTMGSKAQPGAAGYAPHPPRPVWTSAHTAAGFVFPAGFGSGQRVAGTQSSAPSHALEFGFYEI